MQYYSRINQLEKEIAHLDATWAALAKQESACVDKQNRIQSAIARTASISTLRSKTREYERETKRLANIKKKQADASQKRASTTKRLRDYQKRQADVEKAVRRRDEHNQRKLMKQREAQQRRLDLGQTDALTHSPAGHFPIVSARLDVQYDFFICHAREDKDDVVRGLAELLREQGAEVWYDDFTLTVGSRLRKAIENGLAKSKFGVVIVSPHFFSKEWPQRELDGLFALDNGASGNPTQSRILPIWHKVTKDEVLRRSPILADLTALNTAALSTEELADRLLDRLKAE